MDIKAHKLTKFVSSSFDENNSKLGCLTGEKRKVMQSGGDDDGCCIFGSTDSFIPVLHDDVALICRARDCRSDHASLSFLNTRFSMLIKSGYLYELRRRLGIVEHWVYMVCDARGWEAFDPIRNKWMRLPKIPCDDCFN